MGIIKYMCQYQFRFKKKGNLLFLSYSYAIQFAPVQFHFALYTRQVEIKLPIIESFADIKICLNLKCTLTLLNILTPKISLIHKNSRVCNMHTLGDI